jgi:putative Ca2+/H+ antiporter (TMEM165/GDT1 family)
VTITFISVVACELLVKVVPVELVKRVSGVVFILIGAALVLGR